MAESSKSVFVGGFGQDVTADTLYAVFGTFGDIVSVQLPPDPEDRNSASPRHRGFGFVEFQDGTDALDAIDNMHLNELNGRRLRVNIAQSRAGKTLLGTNRAVWEDQAWLKEHAVDSAEAQIAGPPS